MVRSAGLSPYFFRGAVHGGPGARRGSDEKGGPPASFPPGGRQAACCTPGGTPGRNGATCSRTGHVESVPSRSVPRRPDSQRSACFSILGPLGGPLVVEISTAQFERAFGE